MWVVFEEKDMNLILRISVLGQVEGKGLARGFGVLVFTKNGGDNGPRALGSMSDVVQG